MSELKQLTEQLLAFRDARDWKQFHSLKNLIVSLNLETAELLELTQWLSDAEVDTLPAVDEMKTAISEECADILFYLLLIAEKSGIDLLKAADTKLRKNEEKYPISKCKGSRLKYNQLP